MASTARRVGGRPWRRVRDAVIVRDGGVCQLRYPGRCTGTATTADHVLPVAYGGDNELVNLRASCVACNEHRGAGRSSRQRPSPGWLGSASIGP